MRKKWSILLSCLLVFTLLTSSSVLAFDDLKDIKGKEEILDLKNKGIISGTTESIFAPQEKLSYAQGLSLIVKGLDLNIDHLTFIKKPEASDFFTKVPDKAWYAQSFSKAHLNGLTLSKDVDPNQPLTREEFVHYLIEGLNTTGSYPLIALFIMVSDEQEINTDYMGNIQAALITKIATLDEEQKFYPKRAITRAEAAVMLSRTIEFINKHKENTIPGENPGKDKQNEKVSFEVSPITKAVNEVVLTWREAPHPGYGIRVERIEFQDKKALIYYSLVNPDPDQMFPQVITDVKTTTYVDAAYEVQIIQSGSSDSSASVNLAQ